MTRRSGLAAVLASAFVLSACLEPAPPMPRSAAGPLTGIPLADPAVLKIGGSYHLWATGYDQPPHYNIAYTRSDGNLRNWRPVQDAMPQRPSWARPGLAQTLWAPSVYQRGANDYVMYFSAQTRDRYAVVNGQPRGPVWCIGVARASQPQGPFVDARGAPIVCQTGLYGSIDPDVFRDPATGHRYLMWKSEGFGVGDVGRIWSQRLTSNGLNTTGPRHQLLAPEQDWEGRALENPAMVARDGSYWLFYSGNDWWTSRYATGVARCDSPLGPCHRSWSTPIIKSSFNVAGPGGAVPIRGQEDVLVFSAWEPGKVGYWTGGERRIYYVHWVTWGGRPSVS